MVGTSRIWRKLPLFKQFAINKIIAGTHSVLSEIYKIVQGDTPAKDVHKAILPLLIELTYPLKNEIDVLAHERGRVDEWEHLLDSMPYKLKNTNKLENALDRRFAFKIYTFSKYFSPPFPFEIQGGLAFKFNNRYDYLILYKEENNFIKTYFEILYTVFSAMALYWASKSENQSLKEQTEFIKKQLLESNEKLTEAEKTLKRRIHEIDQLFQVSNELFAIVDRDNLINTALLIMVGQLGCDSTFALLLNESKDAYSQFYSKGFGIEHTDIELAKDDPIINYFKNGGDILYFDEIKFKNDMTALMPFFQESKAYMVAPLVVDEHLIGIIACGEKLFGGDYDNVDKRIFRVLMNTITLSFKNLFVYEEATGDSFIDKNTGIANKKYFEKRIREEKSRTKRQKSTLGLLTIRPKDSDTLFQKLDHNTIQSLARKIAGKLEPVVRTEDFLAYIEQGTFVLVAPGVKEETIPTVVERILETLEPFKVAREIHPDQELHFEIDALIYPDKEEEFERAVDKLLKKEVEPKTSGEDIFSDLDFNL